VVDGSAQELEVAALGARLVIVGRPKGNVLVDTR
jgi:hypothetical protein